MNRAKTRHEVHLTPRGEQDPHQTRWCVCLPLTVELYGISVIFHQEIPIELRDL
jgi:hypothetical protein